MGGTVNQGGRYALESLDGDDSALNRFRRQVWTGAELCSQPGRRDLCSQPTDLDDVTGE